MKVLVLASWYPGRTNESAGDFVVRHVEAAGAGVSTFVVFVVKDENIRNGQTEIIKTTENGIIVYRAYYGRSSKISFFEKLFSYSVYLRLQKKIIIQIIADYGLPDITHVHIAMKAGLAALYLKRKFKIPYVVTEHWAGYYQNCVPNIYDKDFFYRVLNKRILKKANLFLPVTTDLGNTVNTSFVPLPFKVVPNVVNTDLFYYENNQPDVFQFLHVSYLNYQKNPEGILRAVAVLADKGYTFKLLLLGNKDESLFDLVNALKLGKIVSIQPAVSYREVASAMNKSSAFVLFSRFENLPCVVLEALCCGLPVISSRVGGITEVIDTSNGILVESEDVQGLANAMVELMDNYRSYNRLQISLNAKEKFNYSVIGSKFIEHYKTVLGQH